MLRLTAAGLRRFTYRGRWVLAGLICGSLILISLVLALLILSARPRERELRVAFGDVELLIPTEYLGTITPAISKTVDHLTLVTVVLYPEMRPMNEQNSGDFTKPGWGSKIDIQIIIGNRNPWDQFLKNVAKSDYDFSDHNYGPSDISGYSGHFTRFDGTFSGKDFYYDGPLSAPKRRMTCSQENSVPYPSCQMDIGIKHGLWVQVAFGRNLLPYREQISNSVVELLRSWSRSPFVLEVE